MRKYFRSQDKVSTKSPRTSYISSANEDSTIIDRKISPTNYVRSAKTKFSTTSRKTRKDQWMEEWKQQVQNSVSPHHPRPRIQSPSAPRKLRSEASQRTAIACFGVKQQPELQQRSSSNGRQHANDQSNGFKSQLDNQDQLKTTPLQAVDIFLSSVGSGASRGSLRMDTFDKDIGVLRCSRKKNKASSVTHRGEAVTTRDERTKSREQNRSKSNSLRLQIKLGSGGEEHVDSDGAMVISPVSIFDSSDDESEGSSLLAELTLLKRGSSLIEVSTSRKSSFRRTLNDHKGLRGTSQSISPRLLELCTSPQDGQGEEGAKSVEAVQAAGTASVNLNNNKEHWNDRKELRKDKKKDGTSKSMHESKEERILQGDVNQLLGGKVKTCSDIDHSGITSGQLNRSLEDAMKEIDTLRQQLNSANQKVTDAQKLVKENSAVDERVGVSKKPECSESQRKYIVDMPDAASERERPSEKIQPEEVSEMHAWMSRRKLRSIKIKKVLDSMTAENSSLQQEVQELFESSIIVDESDLCERDDSINNSEELQGLAASLERHSSALINKNRSLFYARIVEVQTRISDIGGKIQDCKILVEKQTKENENDLNELLARHVKETTERDEEHRRKLMKIKRNHLQQMSSFREEVTADMKKKKSQSMNEWIKSKEQIEAELQRVKKENVLRRQREQELWSKIKKIETERATEAAEATKAYSALMEQMTRTSHRTLKDKPQLEVKIPKLKREIRLLKASAETLSNMLEKKDKKERELLLKSGEDSLWIEHLEEVITDLRKKHAAYKSRQAIYESHRGLGLSHRRYTSCITRHSPKMLQLIAKQRESMDWLSLNSEEEPLFFPSKLQHDRRPFTLERSRSEEVMKTRYRGSSTNTRNTHINENDSESQSFDSWPSKDFWGPDLSSYGSEKAVIKTKTPQILKRGRRARHSDRLPAELGRQLFPRCSSLRKVVV